MADRVMQVILVLAKYSSHHIEKSKMPLYFFAIDPVDLGK